MGFTLKSLSAELGQERIARAIKEQREHLGKRRYSDCQAVFLAAWATNPRKAIMKVRFLLGTTMRGCDQYLFMAHALGKV
jgi:hypothetical protein